MSPILIIWLPIIIYMLYIFPAHFLFFPTIPMAADYHQLARTKTTPCKSTKVGASQHRTELILSHISSCICSTASHSLLAKRWS